MFFVDESSMLGCLDIHRIGVQLARVFGVVDVSFGGASVILAGDFAQLPPPGNGARHETLGKAVWHQFTTVVILRQNMRQRGLYLPILRCWKAELLALLYHQVYCPVIASGMSL